MLRLFRASHPRRASLSGGHWARSLAFYVLPMAALAKGLSYDQLVGRLLDLARADARAAREVALGGHRDFFHQER